MKNGLICLFGGWIGITNGGTRNPAPPSPQRSSLKGNRHGLSCDPSAPSRSLGRGEIMQPTPAFWVWVRAINMLGRDRPVFWDGRNYAAHVVRRGRAKTHRFSPPAGGPR